MKKQLRMRVIRFELLWDKGSSRFFKINLVLVIFSVDEVIY
jgi:hypothetical protein